MLFNSKKKSSVTNSHQEKSYSRRGDRYQKNPRQVDNVNFEQDEPLTKEDFIIRGSEGEKKEAISTKVSSSHRSLIFILSLIGALTTVALPYMTYFANSIQSQELYVGYMLSKGNFPYGSVYGTSGILYYAIVALSYFMGSSAWLAIVQFITHYLSGIYINKILLRLHGKSSIAFLGTVLFGVAQITVGFGGVYAIQWALPSVLLGIWFLIRYFENQRSDEWFIYYGILSGISYFIDPKTILFWLSALVVICLNNIKLKRYARGFYQFLSIVMGTILVVYPCIYVLLSMQVFNNFLDQTDWMSLFYPGLTNSNPWLTIIIQLVYLISLGLITILRKGFSYIKNIQEDQWVQRLFFVSFIIFLPYVLFSQTFEPYTLLPILPFALFLFLPMLDKESEVVENTTSPQKRGSRIRKSDFTILSQNFSQKTHQLILLTMVSGLVFSGYHVYRTQSSASERKLVTATVKDTDSLYVWDETVQLYKTTKANPSTQLALPVNYTGNVSRRNDLIDSLLQDKGDYIVVNNSLSVNKAVREHIKANYETVEVNNLKHYTIYKKK